jgi:hypothetical protein
MTTKDIKHPSFCLLGAIAGDVISSVFALRAAQDKTNLELISLMQSILDKEFKGEL